MSSSFLLYSDLTTRELKTKVGGTKFSFPVFTGGEELSIALRFTETKNGATVETFPNIAGMRASIGRSDAAPIGGTFKLQIGVVTTGSIPFNVTASALQTAINASLTSGLSCVVTQYGNAFLVHFSDGQAHEIEVIENELDPVSLVRVRQKEQGASVEHEITLVQAPIAFTNLWSPIVPPAPSVVKIQAGNVDSSGQFSYPTIQNLTIPASFRGTYRLKFGNARTRALSLSDGTTQIAAALNAIWNGAGQTVSVTNPQTSVASVAFDGVAFNGSDQPLLEVEVITAPPGDNTLRLDLNTSGCYEALRAFDTVTGLYLEVEADVIPAGESAETATSRQVVTLVRQKVTLQRPINWAGMEAASAINWVLPPGPSSYIPFSANQVITGQQFYTATVGNGTSTSYTVTHNLETSSLHLSLSNNATGALLVNGMDYYATVAENTVSLLFSVAPATGGVKVVISTAGPKSAFVDELVIDVSQVTGLSETISELSSNVTALSALLPSIGAGVSSSSANSLTAVTIPMQPTAEIVGYRGPLLTPDAVMGYKETQLPSPRNLSPSSNFDKELWRIAINERMFAAGRRLLVDWGVGLQLLKANCLAQYTLVVEKGSYTSTDNLVAVDWHISTPVISLPLAMTSEWTVHSFGLELKRLASSISLDQQLYGIWSGNNASAPATANFALRCRLVNLDPENISTPKGWVSYGLVPSRTSLVADSAQAVIKS